MKVQWWILATVVAFEILPWQAQAQSFDQAVEKARTYTAQIRVSGSRRDNDQNPRFGSGVILRTDGYIATAAHVLGADSEWQQKEIDGFLLRRIEVRIPDRYGVLEQSWREADFFKDNAQSDVAVIHISGSNFQRADCESLQADRGSKIYRLGFPGRVVTWADEKGGETSIGETVLNFRGNMVSERGMSGGPAIDAAGRVLGLSVSRETDPRFQTQTYTEFVRIQEAINLLPQQRAELGCRVNAPGRRLDRPVDISDKLMNTGNESTLSLQFADQTVSIRAGTYILDGRTLRLRAKRLILFGSVVIRSFADGAAAPMGQPGEAGNPGGQAGGDGQNGGRGLQGGTGRDWRRGKAWSPGWIHFA
jgi:Trypsin-like peptidase domain